MYSCNFCAPFQKEIVDLDQQNRQQVLQLFDEFQWIKLLNDMERAGDDQEIFYSPSVGVVHTDQQHEFSASIVGTENDSEFLLMFTRPKLKSSFFGLIKSEDKRYMSEKTVATREEARLYWVMVLDGDWEKLEAAFA